MEQPVSNNDLIKLRTARLITEQEIAVMAGDVIVAENVITKERRILEIGTLILESNRRILRD